MGNVREAILGHDLQVRKRTMFRLDKGAMASTGVHRRASTLAAFSRRPLKRLFDAIEAEIFAWSKARAFSGEVGIGSPPENASKQRTGAIHRSNWIGKYSRRARSPGRP